MDELNDDLGEARTPKGLINVDGREIPVARESITAGEAIEIAGLVPADAHRLVRVDGGRASLIEADTEIPLGEDVPVFRSGRGEAHWALKVDDVEWDWLNPGILASDVRDIASLPADRELYVDGGTGPVRPGGLIDLTGGAPDVSSRLLPVAPPKRSVPIILNGRPCELATADASFEDLVRLAFPELPAGPKRTFTVTVRRAGADQPDGSLAPQQAARLQPGAVINVSSTDKS